MMTSMSMTTTSTGTYEHNNSNHQTSTTMPRDSGYPLTHEWQWSPMDEQQAPMDTTTPHQWMVSIHGWQWPPTHQWWMPTNDDLLPPLSPTHRQRQSPHGQMTSAHGHNDPTPTNGEHTWLMTSAHEGRPRPPSLPPSPLFPSPPSPLLVFSSPVKSSFFLPQNEATGNRNRSRPFQIFRDRNRTLKDQS